MKRLMMIASVMLIAGCSSASPEGDDLATQQLALSGEKVGVMLSSYGDVDSPDEAKDFVRRCLMDPDVAPIPNFLRPLISTVGWWLDGRNIRAEYEAIGGAANLRARSTDLAQKVAQGMRAKGVNAFAYTGFDFTWPFIGDSLAKMQADGIQRFVIFYEGAQYSQVTQYINIRETRKYLKAHPEWKVNAIAVKSFSDDPRFLDYLGDSIEERVQSDFAQAPADKICVTLPMHGVPTYLPERGDPAVDQMMRAVDYVKNRFPQYLVDFGFQNHDEFPGSKWTQPRHDAAVEELAKNPRCENIIINGRVSFTVDCLETLYDHGIDEPEVIHKVNPNAKVTVEPMFNSESRFVDFTRDLALEALAGQGDLEVMR